MEVLIGTIIRKWKYMCRLIVEVGDKLDLEII